MMKDQVLRLAQPEAISHVPQAKTLVLQLQVQGRRGFVHNYVFNK